MPGHAQTLEFLGQAFQSVANDHPAIRMDIIESGVRRELARLLIAAAPTATLKVEAEIRPAASEEIDLRLPWLVLTGDKDRYQIEVVTVHYPDGTMTKPYKFNWSGGEAGMTHQVVACLCQPENQRQPYAIKTIAELCGYPNGDLCAGAALNMLSKRLGHGDVLVKERPYPRTVLYRLNVSHVEWH